MGNKSRKPDIISLDELEREEIGHEHKPVSPQREGEESVSGSMPDPESDDDTLKNAHDMGLQRGEGYDNAEELNGSRDIDSNSGNT
jgi:hypothetical protein